MFSLEIQGFYRGFRCVEGRPDVHPGKKDHPALHAANFSLLILNGEWAYTGNMKIDGPSKTQGAGGSKKSGKVDSDGSFGDFIASAPKSTASAAPTHSIARVDALLSVQAAESPTERAARKRMKERGESVLQELDKLRHSILTGTMTLGQIVDIADVVASHRERVTDPKLTAILDEIDLRAQIELAKARKALEAARA